MKRHILPYISSKKQESLDFQSNVLPDRCAVDGQTWNHGGRASFLPGLFSGHPKQMLFPVSCARPSKAKSKFNLFFVTKHQLALGLF